MKVRSLLTADESRPVDLDCVDEEHAYQWRTIVLVSIVLECYSWLWRLLYFDDSMAQLTRKAWAFIHCVDRLYCRYCPDAFQKEMTSARYFTFPHFNACIGIVSGIKVIRFTNEYVCIYVYVYVCMYFKPSRWSDWGRNQSIDRRTSQQVS